MAKKSKTQRAKASAARQARKAERKREELSPASKASGKDTALEEALAKKAEAARAADGDKPERSQKAEKAATEPKKSSKKVESKPKKKRFQFFRDVRAEMKRVTWPTRLDVLRWSGVVVVALLFFGIFTAVLDNLIVTPLLILISGADPASVDWMSVFSFSGTGGTESSAADAASSSSAATEA